jgi:hypothetical protein
MRRLSLWFAVLLAIMMVGDVKANIVYLAQRGAGLGNVDAILSIATNTGTESGCVSWNGAADVIGVGCPAGITGGDERLPGVATKTLSIAQLGLTDASALRIVFNANEPGPDGSPENSISLQKLVLTIYGATTGAQLFQGSIGPINFSTTNPGLGNGFEGPQFQLDAPQAAAAQAAAFNNPANRIGLAAQVSDTEDGFENFFIINGPSAPTMSTWLLMTLGALLVGAGWMALRQRRRVMQQTPVR